MTPEPRATLGDRSREYPSAPIVGVGAVVLRDGKILLIQRAREPMLGAWTLPGGALKVGETMAEGVAREVLEETGLRVSPREVIATLDRIVRDAASRVRFHYLLIDWICDCPESDSLDPCCGDDASAAEWVAPEEMDRLGVDSVTRDVINRALRRQGEAQA